MLLADGASDALPDVALYDRSYDLQRALTAHRRDDAMAQCEAMAAEAPGHRLTLHARRSLAAYDADDVAALACVERQLTQHPDDDGLLLARLGHLRALGRRADRIAQLQAIVVRKDSDPIFRVYLAQELADDAREHAAAERHLRRALRLRRFDAVAYATLASILWAKSNRREDALRLYRWAASLEDKREGFVGSYFGAARHFKRSDEALRMLRDRVTRFGDRSAFPSRTLFWAYEELARVPEGFAVLDAALARHPNDGELHLDAARSYARYGNRERAEALLEAARGHAQHTHWLRAAADVAAERGALADACDRWREVIAAEPLALDAHRRYAQLLAETAGVTTACAHVESVAAQFPHHHGLNQLCIEWLRDQEQALDATTATATRPAQLQPSDATPARTERAIRQLIENQPADAWARRELAHCLIRQHRIEEAIAEARVGCELEPENPANLYYLGRALAGAGRIAESQAAYRTSIQHSVDFYWSFGALLDTCGSLAERREVLDFIRGELVRQTIFGDGLVAFRQQALDSLDAESVLALLREALAARPDLVQAHAMVAKQLAEMKRLDEALAAATTALERFPLAAIMWLDLSSIHRLRGDADAERQALERAIEINPSWSTPARTLAESYQRAGESEKAASLLERVTSHVPFDAASHAALAEVYWKLGRREDAVARAKRAVLVDPGLEAAWFALRHYARENGDADGDHAPAALARKLTERRPGSVQAWLVLARVLEGAEQLPERLAALDRALALDPRFMPAHDLRALILAEAGRFDEAIAACSPEVWQGRPRPAEFSGREAWIESQRGNLPRAIELMRTAIEQEPAYYWGWGRLCDWLEMSGDVPAYVEAATRMSDRWPNDVPALGTLGDALLRTGDRRRARETLERAVQLAPEYEFGVNMLFDIALEDRDLDRAQGVLELLKRHGRTEVILTRTAQLAAARMNARGALDALTQLCAEPGTMGPWPLERSLDAIEGRGWGMEAERVLTSAVARPDANPLVMTMYMRRLAKLARWPDAWQALDKLLTRATERGTGIGPVESSAIRETVHASGTARQSWFVQRLLRKHRALIQSDDLAWAQAGAARGELGQHKQLIEWMSDWPTRPGRQAWMTHNLVLSYLSLGREDEAREVIVDALALKEDDSTIEHRIWLAAIDASRASSRLDADPTGADAAVLPLAGIRRETLRPYYQFVYDMAHAHAELARDDRSKQRLDEVNEHRARAEYTAPDFASVPPLARLHEQLKRSSRLKYGLMSTPSWARRVQFTSTPTAQPVNAGRGGGGGTTHIWVWIVLAIILVRMLMTLFNP